MERKFEGVWIPAELYLNEELSWSEKILLIEINSLDNSERGCFASNKYLGDFLKISEGSCANMISKLKAKGYIEQVFFDGRNRGLKVHKNMNSAFISKKEASQKYESSLHKNMKAASQKDEHNSIDNNIVDNKEREQKKYSLSSQKNLFADSPKNQTKNQKEKNSAKKEKGIFSNDNPENGLLPEVVAAFETFYARNASLFGMAKSKAVSEFKAYTAANWSEDENQFECPIKAFASIFDYQEENTQPTVAEKSQKTAEIQAASQNKAKDANNPAADNFSRLKAEFELSKIQAQQEQPEVFYFHPNAGERFKDACKAYIEVKRSELGGKSHYPRSKAQNFIKDMERFATIDIASCFSSNPLEAYSCMAMLISDAARATNAKTGKSWNITLQIAKDYVKKYRESQKPIENGINTTTNNNGTNGSTTSSKINNALNSILQKRIANREQSE